jgi:hypothetical protein
MRLWSPVDLALQVAGDLPSQQAKADLVKQDIEEIGNRLNEAGDARRCGRRNAGPVH